MGKINYRDAGLLLIFATKSEICQALATATVWDLRDKVLRNIREYLTHHPTVGDHGPKE